MKNKGYSIIRQNDKKEKKEGRIRKSKKRKQYLSFKKPIRQKQASSLSSTKRW